MRWLNSPEKRRKKSELLSHIKKSLSIPTNPLHGSKPTGWLWHNLYEKYGKNPNIPIPIVKLISVSKDFLILCKNKAIEKKIEPISGYIVDCGENGKYFVSTDAGTNGGFYDIAFKIGELDDSN